MIDGMIRHINNMFGLADRQAWTSSLDILQSVSSNKLSRRINSPGKLAL